LWTQLAKNESTAECQQVLRFKIKGSMLQCHFCLGIRQSFFVLCPSSLWICKICCYSIDLWVHFYKNNRTLLFLASYLPSLILSKTPTASSYPRTKATHNTTAQQYRQLLWPAQALACTPQSESFGCLPMRGSQ
jgi:hypothetical protein